MSEKVVVIDLDVEYHDKTKIGVEETDKQMQRLLKKMRSAGVGAKEAQGSFGGLSGEAERMAKRMKVAGTAGNQADTVLRNLSRTAASLAKKTVTIPVKVLDYATKPLRGLLNYATSIKGVITGLIAGQTAQKFIVNPIQMQVETEGLESSFQVMLGSAEAAKRRIDDLTDFAGQTPFTRDQIYQASRTLEVFTKGALSTGDGLRLVGDIAAGTGQQFEDVSLWMGRLYDAMANGNPIGEMTSRLQEMGAISGVERTKLEQLAKSGRGIAETWPEAAKQFERFNGLMDMQSDQLGNLLLGVKSFYNNTVLKRLGAGLGEGIKPLLQRFRQWRSENKALIDEIGQAIQRTAKEVSSRVIGFFEKTAQKVSQIIRSDKFQEADLFSKVRILWDDIIGKPLTNWWNQKGKERINDLASKIGSTLGGFFSNGILALFGIDAGSVLNDGATVGKSFADGFLKSFNADKIWEAVKNGFSKMIQSAGKLFPGGDSPDAMSYLSAMGLGFGALKAYRLGAPLYQGAKGFGSILSGSETSAERAIRWGAGNPSGNNPFSTGALSVLGKLGPAGVVLGSLGLLGAFNDFKKAAKTANEKDRSIYRWSGVARTGMVGAGAGAGFLLGSIIPGIGNAMGAALGAGLGGLASLFAGGNVGKKISDWLDGSADIKKVTNNLQEANAEFIELRDRQEEVKSLSHQFEELNYQIKSGKLPAEDLATAQDKLKGIVERLNSLYPDLITQYDLENGKISEKLGLIKGLTEAERKRAGIKYRAAALEFKEKLPEMKDQLVKNKESAQNHLDNALVAEEKASKANELTLEWKALESDVNLKKNDPGVWEDKKEALDERINAVFMGQRTGSIEHIAQKYTDQALKEYQAAIDADKRYTETLADIQSGYDIMTQDITFRAGVDMDDLKQKMQEAGKLKSDIETKGVLSQEEYPEAQKKYDALIKEIDSMKDKITPVMDEVKSLNQEFAEIDELKRFDIDFYAHWYGFDKVTQLNLFGSNGGGSYTPTGKGFGRSGNGAVEGLTDRFNAKGRFPSNATPGGYATGTSWAAPGLHWVGENGPELLRFRGGERVYNASDSWKIAQSLERRPSAAATAPLQISLGGIKIEVSASGDGGNVAAAIEKQLPGLANELCAEVAQKLTKIYANMPLSVEG